MKKLLGGSVWRCLKVEVYMWQTLGRFKDRYGGAKTQVRTVREDLEHFLVLMGLYQRSIPYLFNFLFALMMDVLTW